jgi:hypothetical protein
VGDVKRASFSAISTSFFAISGLAMEVPSR